MRIYNVNNTVQFGYNKQLNDKVNKKLKNDKVDKEISNHLLELNQFCLKTEDLLRKAEKENNEDAEFFYSYLLADMKPVITQELNERFPSLKYRQTELETYEKEKEERNIKNDEHWLNEVIDELSMYENIEIVRSKYEAEAVDNELIKFAEVDKAEDKCPEYLEKFVPTALSPVGFSNIGGMDSVKELLEDKILFPLRNPELAKLDEIEYGKKYPRGTMFYGPPGCGKTVNIEALTAEADLPMYKLKISKAGSKYINESSSNIQKAYEYVCKVAEDTGKPVFFVIDELESVAPKRNSNSVEDLKMVGTLLQIIEEARAKNIIVLAATNNFDMVDEALRSRFDDKVYIGLPDDETRRAVLQIHLNKRSKGKALAQNTEELGKVVALTQGFSNRDIAILTDKASLIARKDNRRDITADDFIKPVQENQNMKIQEAKYKDKQTIPRIGFSKSKN